MVTASCWKSQHLKSDISRKQLSKARENGVERYELETTWEILIIFFK